MWKALAGIGDDAWRDAMGMRNAQVPSRQLARGMAETALSSAGSGWTRSGPESPGRAAAAPGTRTSGRCRSRNWSRAVIYAYSFICTNIDVSTPAKAAAVEHWYRHRTSIENIFRDSKHGAALRHLPSGHEQVNTAWMWASLIATAVAAWLRRAAAGWWGWSRLAALDGAGAAAARR